MSKSTNKHKESNKSEKARRRGADIALITLFCAFFTVFFALILILPKKEGELSQHERRVLAKAPKLTFDNLVRNHKFADQTDAWLEDHFPGRPFFVSFYSYLNRLTGRNASETIIAGKAGRLFAEPLEKDSEQITKNAETLKKFIDENGLNAFSAVIPSAGYMLGGELPKLHRNYHDGEIITEFNSRLGKSASPADIESLIKSKSDPGKYYYKTDHHLTMAGSYLVYAALGKELGFKPIPESGFQKTSYEFYGTSYGRSGLMLTKPDSIEIWRRNGDENITVTTADGKNKITHRGMINAECLKEGTADKYAAYLYGNHGVTSVVNPNVETGALMLFKDSYANAVAPLLSAHYHEIIMIDTRYYNPETEIPAEIAAEKGITDFIILCGTDTVNGNVEAAWIAQERS